MKVKINQASSMLVKIIKAGLVPMMVGSPATGKSETVHAIAKQFNLKLIDFRLSQCDPCDFLGFPKIKGERAGYLPMDTFPLENDLIPLGYSGWLLFLDEANSAPQAVQAAAYKLILDRMVGNHKLHKNVAIVAAGNLETDNAIVEPMSTALQSRMVHLELVVCHLQWLEWASSQNIDSRITSFISFKPDSVYTFHPDHTDKTYASPRTWVFADRLLKQADIQDPDALPLLTGTLSEGVAREFVSFCKIYHGLPSLAAITQSPEATLMPEEPSTLFALTGFLGSHATEDSLTALMKYIKRMPKEFQIITLREMLRRNKKHRTHPAVHSWTLENAAELF